MGVIQAGHPTARLMVALALVCSAAGPVVARPAGREAGAAVIAEGFERLREGRLTAAEAKFGEAERLLPGDPAPAYYRALAIWWQGLFEENLAVVLPRFDAAVGRAIDLAADRDDPEAWLVKGSAHLLRAQVRAKNKQALKAGWDARRGKKALEAALREAPHANDAYFGLGAYNYYADRVSTLVKGIRALLFIPGGNDRLGLRQLQVAADHGTRMRVEAHLLLAVILSSEDESRYDDALAHVRRARILAPRSPAVALALADLLDGTGREDEAIETLSGFLAMSETARFDYHDDFRARAAVHVARLYLRRARPTDARRVLSAMLGGTDGSGQAVARARRVLLQIEWDLGGPSSRLASDWGLEFTPGEGCEAGQLRDLAELEARVPRAGGGWREVRVELGRLAAATPCDGVLLPRRRVALGTASLLAGDLDSAQAQFQSALSSATVAAEAAGWSQIFLGRIAAARGETDAALQHFRLASRMPGFSDHLRAAYYAGNMGAAPWPQGEVEPVGLDAAAP